VVRDHGHLLIPRRERLSAGVEDETEWIMDHIGPPTCRCKIHRIHPTERRWTSRTRRPRDAPTSARAIAREERMRYVYTGNVHDHEGGTPTCLSAAPS